jgi:hypothetical protein
MMTKITPKMVTGTHGDGPSQKPDLAILVKSPAGFHEPAQIAASGVPKQHRQPISEPEENRE